MINIAYGALTSGMTRDQNQLTSISSVRMFFANFASVLVAFGVPTITEFFGKNHSQGTSYQLTMLVMSLLGGVLLLITYYGTKERIIMPTSAEKIRFIDIKELLKDNKPMVIMCALYVLHFAVMTIGSAAGTYFMTYNIGRPDLLKYYMLLGNLPAFAVMPLLPFLVRKLGKKMVLYLATFIYIVGLVSLYFIPSQMVGLLFTMKLLSAVGGVGLGLTWAMVPEIIVYTEYKSGKRMSGSVYALIGFFFKIGMAAGGIVLGFFLQIFHYQPNQVQGAASLNGIALLVSLIPALLLFVSLFLVKQYELDEKRYAEVVKVVEERERGA
jgi:GPH family glycoside/pentoside/hexuronide:cation symporter